MYNLVQTGHLSKEEKSGHSLKYYAKRMKAIKKIMAIPAAEIAKEEIHTLRIEIKKIKALFDLIHCVHKNFELFAYFKPYEQVFRTAGEIRETQVELELLQKYLPDTPGKYLEQLRRRQEKKIKKIENLFLSGIADKLMRHKKDIVAYLDSVSEKEVMIILKRKAADLNKLMVRSIFKEQKLHTVRKKLKNFYNIVHTTYPNMKIPKPCDRLQDLFGRWHDSQVAIDHLRKALYSSLFTQDEISHLQKIRHELLGNRERLFDQIISTYVLIKRT